MERHCPNCGNINVESALYCARCGTALPGTSGGTGRGPAGGPTEAAPVHSAQSVVYAGFWLRVVATIIDTLILGIAGALVAFEPFSNILIAWLYFAFMESSQHQATLGKKALDLKVTTLDGRRISFSRATVRHFAKILSAMLLMVGFIMAAFTARKQALHDLIAECLVVRIRLS